MTEDWNPNGDADTDEIGPGDPDYDLSEAHGYSWEPDRSAWPPPRWVVAAVSFLLVAALLAPALVFILRS